MLFLKQILRSLWRSRFLNTINLLGIVIGLATCTLLLLFVKNQYQADSCFKGHENIYRVKSNWGSHLSEPFAKLIRDNIPEVKSLTIYQLSWSWQDLAFHNEINYEIENVVYADSSFFNVLDFKTLSGDAKNALNREYSIVLTKDEALRIFNTTQVLGKTLLIKTSDFDTHNYTITAVLDDIPKTSSFHFKAVLPLQDLMNIDWYKRNADGWGTFNYSAYLMLHKWANPVMVERKIDSLVTAQAPAFAHDAIPFKLSALDGLHFELKDNDGVFATNNKVLVNLLGIIGLFILLLAGINYFNLTLSQLEQNNTRLGISKVVGANRMDLALQSMVSTIVMLVIALVFTVLIVIFLLPSFNHLTGSSFNLEYLKTTSNLVLFGTIFIVAAILFGAFPAFISSKQTTLDLLSKKSIFSQKQPLMQVLVVFQFVLSIILVASTLLINKQNNFLLSADYGIKKDQMLYLPISPDMDDNLNTFEHEIEQLAPVEGLTKSSEVFGKVNQNWGRNMYGNGEAQHIEITNMWVSPDFFNLFGIKVIQGKVFNNRSAKNRDMIYNEAFCKKYGIEKPLQTSLSKNYASYNTIGVVKDFCFGTLHEAISPFAFICSDGSNLSTIFIKLKTNNHQQTQQVLANIENIWNKHSPNFPFEYKFMDTHYQEVYDNEIRMSRVLSIASALSIILAGLGLFCLSFFIIGKRIKEIGVRKVNGAKIFEILALLNGAFVRWVAIAFIIAVPMGWYAMSKWLENFAYKTNLSWWIFIVAGLMTLLIALITVSFQSWKAARQNPVEALRYE